MKHEQVILGSVPSKSNCYKIITFNGHSSLGKTSAMNTFEKNFYLQCGAYRNRNIQGFFELYVDVYFQSNQPDLDNSLKGLLDCLQTCKAIKNDRNCVKIVANKFIDKNNPRIEFTLVEVNGVEHRDSKQPGLFDD
jgi:Holliday junction resolvase RusA-like endonuclease